jgi:protein involved in polysaccharide export with SLBB domain
VTATALSRVSDAIASAKGVKPGASLRSIRLQRGGAVSAIDLYRYTYAADNGQDPLLAPGDRIYVAQAANVVAIAGEVKYPGVFEILPGESLAALLGYAGGFTADAVKTAIEVVRNDGEGAYALLMVNFTEQPEFIARNGDRITVRSGFRSEETVMVEGALYGKPLGGDQTVAVSAVPILVAVPYYSGLSVLKVLDLVGGPTTRADGRNSMLVRKKDGVMISVDVEKLWSGRNLQDDRALEPGDHLFVPMKRTEVAVLGEVRSPGRFPWLPGYTVAEYLRAAGGVNPDAGDPNGISFLDAAGGKTRATAVQTVEPGATIFVDKNLWTVSREMMSNVLVVSGFIGGLVALTQSIITLVISLK